MQNPNDIALYYDKYAVVHQEIGRRLIEKLNIIQLNPTTILDLGAGTGFLHPLLRGQYPNAHIISLDISIDMLRWNIAQKNNSHFKNASALRATADLLPFKNNSIDFVFSNSAFYQFSNAETVLLEIKRVLKPEGLLLFSTLGPDTVHTLNKQLLTQHHNPLHAINPLPLIDMHHIGDHLLKLGFDDPVVDRETITLTYSHLKDIFMDLKNSGDDYLINHAILPIINDPVLLNTLNDHYAPRTHDNALMLCFEVIYGHAFSKPTSFLQTMDEDGMIRFGVDDLALL